MMKLRPNQKGFTLIELLIVIGILSILAAVAIPAYFRFFGQGEEEANLTELSNIQSAMDAMLAQNGISFVDEPVAPTNDFSDLPAGGLDGFEPEPLYPEFLRFGDDKNPTKCLYTWNRIGLMEQSACP